MESPPPPLINYKILFLKKGEYNLIPIDHSLYPNLETRKPYKKIEEKNKEFSNLDKNYKKTWNIEEYKN